MYGGRIVNTITPCTPVCDILMEENKCKSLQGQLDRGVADLLVADFDSVMEHIRYGDDNLSPDVTYRLDRGVI